MLLDCWTEKIPYGALRSRMIKEWHSVYGPKNGKQRKPDVALVGHDGMSDAQITDLRTANIIVPTYKMGDEDDVERAHKAAAIVDEGVVFVPQSTSRKGQFMSWSRELIDQCDRFPNDKKDLVSTMTRALLYIRDSGLLEMPEADFDEVEYEADYYKSSNRKELQNPYAM